MQNIVWRIPAINIMYTLTYMNYKFTILNLKICIITI